MSKKEKSSLFSQIVVAVAIALVAGGTAPWWWPEVKGLFTPPPEPPVPTGQPQGPTTPSHTDPRCKNPLEWDTDFQRCVRKVTIPSKSFSIPLELPVSTIDGRIDFYANTERLPDSNGEAMYSGNKGALQVVVSVMLGKRMVGVQREVIYYSNEGAICKVSSLKETTGWLKKMKVAYVLYLDTDCKEAGGFCQAGLRDSGRRVQLTISGLMVTIGNNCPL